MRISDALLHVLASPLEQLHGYKPAKQIGFPALPFKADRPKMAMDDAGGYPYGGYLNVNTVAGQAAFGLFFPGYPYLAELAQRSEFRQPVATTAKEMTRKWIVFKSKGLGDKSAKIRELEDEFTRLKIRNVFRRALVHDGFYGLGHIYIDIKGHKPHEPLPIEKQTIEVGSLLGFKNVEPMWTTPLVFNSDDPFAPTFYKPEAWMVLSRRTDASRLMQIISYEVPDILKPAYNFGGISLSQLIEPYVTRWLKTVDSVNRLISNFSIIYLQTDMSAILEGGPNADLVKRMRLFARDRDNGNVFLTDKDTELLQQLAVPLSGLSELQAQAQEHQAAPTHLPLVVLTGITPAGLNASSESEIEVFHDWNHSQQEDVIRDPLTDAMHVVMLNRWGHIDEDITFDFVPLKQLTGEALARVKKTQAEMDQIYVDLGAVDAPEVRQKIATDSDSGYNNLDPNKEIEPPEDPEVRGGGSGDDDDDDSPADEAA